MARKRKAKRSMRIVPRVLLGSVAVAVVPALAIEACGGDTGSSFTSTDSSTEGCDPTSTCFAVAAPCFDGSCTQGVAVACFDGSTNPACGPFDAGADHDAEGGDADDDAADSNGFG
jgi:hypothetical protein